MTVYLASYSTTFHLDTSGLPTKYICPEKKDTGKTNYTMTRNRNLVVLLIGVVFLFVTSVALVVVFFVSSIIKESDEIEKVNNHEYRYRNFFPETEESIVGFVSIQSQLKEDEFITYEQNDGSHVIISPFSLDEYRCTGSCYCGNDERRTSGSASFPVKGILHLVAALTTLSAIKLSKEYFDEKCAEKLSCEEHEIVRSEVDGCVTMISETSDEEKITHSSEETTLIPDQDLKKKKKKKKKKGPFEFFCKGNCIPLLNVIEGIEHMEKEGAKKGILSENDKTVIKLIKQNKESVIQQVKDFGCEKLELEQKVKIDWKKGKGMSKIGLENNAKLLFEKKLHREFCNEDHKIRLPNKFGKDVVTQISFCAGTDGKPNPSVVCLRNE